MLGELSEKGCPTTWILVEAGGFEPSTFGDVRVTVVPTQVSNTFNMGLTKAPIHVIKVYSEIFILSFKTQEYRIFNLIFMHQVAYFHLFMSLLQLKKYYFFIFFYETILLDPGRVTIGKAHPMRIYWYYIPRDGQVGLLTYKKLGWVG